MGWDMKDKTESTNGRLDRETRTGEGREVGREGLLRVQHVASPPFPSRYSLQQSWRSAQTGGQGAGTWQEKGKSWGVGGRSGEGAAAAASGWAMGRLIAVVSGQPRGSLHLPREVPYRQDAPLPGSPLQAPL